MWQLKNFEQLTTRELFEIYKIRVAVFVVEQNCAYPEVDNKDLIATHLFAQNNSKIIAYCRIIPEQDGIHIGRVLIAEFARGKGLARELMQKALSHCEQSQNIYVQAQAHLQDFYGSLGFKPISDVYLEDNIPHLDMLYCSTSSMLSE
ncbi:GNAT family N-acetyltransferase [Pasteurellaceae bacterium 15-036681]|nr:GNAT family N-acetyltransferase [Pasteurellaceae bacterium 15-036681]